MSNSYFLHVSNRHALKSMAWMKTPRASVATPWVSREMMIIYIKKLKLLSTKSNYTVSPWWDMASPPTSTPSMAWESCPRALPGRNSDIWVCLKLDSYRISCTFPLKSVVLTKPSFDHIWSPVGINLVTLEYHQYKFDCDSSKFALFWVIFINIIADTLGLIDTK